MSEQERHEIIGRLADNRKSTRQNIALIEVELFVLGDVIRQIGEALKQKDFLAARAAYEAGHRVLKGDLSRFEARLSELETLGKRLADYDRQWDALGLDQD